GLRVISFEAPSQPLELVARLLKRRTAPESPADGELAVVSVVEEGPRGISREGLRHRQRKVEVRLREDEHPREGLRGDADDREGRAVDADDTSDHRGITPEFPLPEPRRENHKGVPAGRAVLVVAEGAADRRLDAENAEVVSRDQDPRPKASRRLRIGG